MIRQIIDNNAEIKPNSKKLEALKEYFAGCFTAEGAFDIERFKDMMKDEVDISNEGYSLDFLGKDYANLIASIDTTTVIEPDLEHNEKPENKDSENIYISGDNLDALKHLLKSYAGKVKCIYIDPPYNTGSDGFVYNDKFRFTPEELEKKLSIDADEAKRILDLTSRGSSTHSAWLMFMSPRLQLARELLSKDGVIFISIDDNEQANLKLLCDYVFGEENFVGQIVIVNNLKGRNDKKNIATCHEYLLAYGKDDFEASGLPLTEEQKAQFDQTDSKGNKYQLRDLRKRGQGDRREDRPNMYFPIYYNTETKESSLEKKDGWIEIFPLRGDKSAGRWRWGMDTVKKNISIIEPYYSRIAEKWGVNYRVYLNPAFNPVSDSEEDEVRDSKSKSFWNIPDLSTDVAKRQYKDLLPDADFDYPKSVSLIKRVIQIGAFKDSIIVDFFSGSGTTAQSIFELNFKENHSNKFILVQLQEEIDNSKSAYKAGYRTIDEIGQERIKRAAAKIKAENPLFAGDLGFKHYTLRDVSDNVLDKLEKFDPKQSGFANNILEEFGRETVLETWKVRDGYGMNAKMEEVQLADYTAYQCGDHLYLTDEGMGDEAITALVEKYGDQSAWGPHYVVLFGYSFNFGATDALKKNLPLLNEGEKQIKINIDIRY